MRQVDGRTDRIEREQRRPDDRERREASPLNSSIAQNPAAPSQKDRGSRYEHQAGGYLDAAAVKQSANPPAESDVTEQTDDPNQVVERVSNADGLEFPRLLKQPLHATRKA